MTNKKLEAFEFGKIQNSDTKMRNQSYIKKTTHFINSNLQFKRPSQQMSFVKEKIENKLFQSENVNFESKSSQQCLCQSHLIRNQSIQSKMRKNSSLQLIILVLVFFSSIPTANCFTVSISSSQIYTGVTANYFFTINSHNNPSNLILTFSDWSPNIPQPFISTYMVAQNTTGNGLSCINRITNTIECNISVSVFPGSVIPSQIVLKMSGIHNPSSSKPYPVSLYLNGTSGSSTQTATLTVTQPRESSLLIDNYSYEVGKKSSALIYLTFRNYLASTTYLQITYNSVLTTIDMISDTAYFVGTDSVGLKSLTSWSNPSQSFRTLKMNITNPSYAISFTVEALQYFIEGGVKYKIQKYTLTLQISSVQYSQIGAVSPQNIIRLGTNDNTLSLSSKCQIGTVNGPSKNAYFQVKYDNTLININAGSTCVSSSTNGTVSTCTLNIPVNSANTTNTFLLTKIKSLIPSSSIITSTVLTIQSWSYFSTLSQFYTTCLSSLSIDVQPQVLSPSTSLVSCNSIVGQSNTLTLQMNVQNAAVSDVVVVKSFSGKIVNKTGSLSFTYNSASNQYEAVLSIAQIINSTNIQLILSLTNPTYLPSQQPSIQILLLRTLISNNGSLNTYAQTSTSFSVCPVNNVLSNSTNNPLSLSNSSTYKSNVAYTIQFSSTSIQFKDYALNDYFIINFKNKVSDGANYAETESPFQLNSFSSTILPQILINSQYSLASEIISSSSLKIKLNSSSVLNLINDPNISSLLLTIKSLSNPFFVSDVFCSIKTYTSTNLQKQSLLTALSPINSDSNSELNLQTSSVITLLESSNTINLQISSQSRKAILSASYSFITSLFIIVKAPFSCLNTNISNEMTFTFPAMNTTDINISLNNCTLGYFNDYTRSIEVQQYAKFSHSNLTQNLKTTSSLYSIRSTCGDQCHMCDSNTLKCQHCFNSTYSTFNFFSSLDQKCYNTCPIGTYSSSSTCLSCHSICASCTNAAFNSCLTCAANFTKNSASVCESTCGSNMYLSNGVCTMCNANCQGCLSENSCYNCKSGAVLVGTSCVFSQCQSPCQTCQGSASFCLTCIQSSSHSYYFYQNSCVETCPDDSFKYEDLSNSLHPKVCMKVQSSNIFFVGCILSLISFGIGVGIRCCARKKSKLSSISNDDRDALIRTTNFSNKLNESYGLKQSQQNINKTQAGNNLDNGMILQGILKKYLESPKMKVYKLNLLRFMTVLMGYIEIVCAVVILIQGGIYNPKGVNEMIAVGLAGLLITNLIFGIRYFTKVYKKLSAKRQRFIEINIKRIPSKVQIEPEPIQQPVRQENSDQNKEENPNKSIKQTNPKINQIEKAMFQSQKSSQMGENSPQQKQRLKLNKKLLSDFDNQMLKQLFIALFSTILTLRTYNILRSNLFVLFSNQDPELNKNPEQALSLNQSKSPRQGVNSNMALNLPHRNNQVIDIKKTEVIGSKRTSPLKTNSKQSVFNVIKIQTREAKPQLNKKQSERTRPQKPPVLNKTSSLPQNLINSIRPFSIEQQPTKNPLLQIKQEQVNKFLHPFYTYIMFASLIVVSMMFAIASAILIFNNRYQNMMIWGIDALIVIFISFLLNIFDLWKAVNLPKHQQHSQVSSVANDINQTMENLKNVQEDGDNLNLQIMAQDQDVNKLNATKKFSTAKKYSNQKGSSPLKNKASQLKGGSIRQEQIEIDPFQKIKSPKSPSQRTEKTKAFGSKHKSPNKSSGSLQQYPQEKPPQLKIFDDLQIEQNKIGKFVKAQKLPKDLSKKMNFNSKVRSSNRSFNGRKTQMSSEMLTHTTRGKKEKNYKMQDIYLGFLQQQQRQSVPRQEDDNQDINETDEMTTVKIQSRDLLNSIKQSSVININSEQQVGDHDWKLKPLKVIETKIKNLESKKSIEEEEKQ